MEKVLNFCKDTITLILGFVLNLARETAALVTRTVAQLTGRAMMYVGEKCWQHTRKLIEPVLKIIMIVSVVVAVVSGGCYLLSRHCSD